MTLEQAQDRLNEVLEELENLDSYKEWLIMGGDGDMTEDDIDIELNHTESRLYILDREANGLEEYISILEEEE